MVIMARVTAPFVWTLDRSSGLILRLLGWPGGEQEVTAEELQMIFAEATRSGVIEEEERALMTSVMRWPIARARGDDAAHRTPLDRAGRQPADLTEAIEDSPIRCCWWPMARPIASSAWSRFATCWPRACAATSMRSKA
jgi:putative hemolysin